MIQEKSVYIVKGSGTSGCLCTQNLDDLEDFQEFKLSGIEISQIKQIELSGLFMIILMQNGDVYKSGTWNKEVIFKPQPMQVIRPIEKISCGWDHALMYSKQNGKHIVYGIGSNKFGQLSNANPKTFTQDILTVVEYSIEQESSIVIHAGFRQSYWASQFQVCGCGQNKNYQLGENGQNSIVLPQKIDQIKNIIKIASGKKFMLALTEDGTVYGMGSNEYECLKDKAVYKEKHVTSLLQLKEGVQDIQCGWNHCLFFMKNGRVQSQGRNNFGQLGRKTEAINREICFKQKIRQISSGSQFSFAIGQSNTLYGWGWNEHKNIAGKQDFYLEPIEIAIPLPKQYLLEKCITYPAITILKLKNNPD